MSCVNEMQKRANYASLVTQSASSRFTYHSLTPRLYHCASSSVCLRTRDLPPSLFSIQRPLLRRVQHQSSSCGTRSVQPSFSISSSSCSPSRRQSSLQQPPLSVQHLFPAALVARRPSGDPASVRYYSFNHTVPPDSLRPHLPCQRKIKSAGDLVLEVTMAARHEREAPPLVPRSFH